MISETAPEDAAFLEAIVQRIEEDSAPRSVMMGGFARAYLNRLPWSPEHSPEALFREIKNLYEFIEKRTSSIAVRAFNPTLETHGYESGGTVVEILVDDSPFLVDSITTELMAHQLQVARLLHPVLGTRRDEDGILIGLGSARSSEMRESVQHYVLERQLFPADLPALEKALTRVLEDVGLAVRDFAPMLGILPRMVDLARTGAGHYPSDELDEATAFLQWLADDNFVFLGYREYELYDTPEGRTIRCVEDSGLGILSDPAKSNLREPTLLSSLSPQVAARYEKGELLVISKTNQRSTVHRRARMDYVGVRVMGADGETVGEARLLGLFTSKAYMERASRTPVLRRKLDSIAQAEDLIEGSHDHKAIVALFESFPKDELLGVPTEDLRRLLLGLLALQERAEVQLFVRRDLLDRSARVLLAIPRDRYSTTLAKRLEDLFLERFEGTSVDFNLTMAASDLAHLHYRIWVGEKPVPDVAFDQLEGQVLALTRSWAERVSEVLTRKHGAANARELVSAWSSRFPPYYTSSTDLAVAAGDIEHLAQLMASGRESSVGLQNEENGSERLTRIALYGHGKRPLSDLIPALEDMGLRVVEEVPTRISGREDLFIHDFGVVGPDGRELDLENAGPRISEGLTAAWNGDTESDSLSRLVLVGGLDYGQVEILRAYRTYWRLVSPTFTVKYVNDALVEHAGIVSMLMDLFAMRFDPAEDTAEHEALRYEILSHLDSVASLDQDRILRGFLRLIDATLRTNVYRPDRQSISFKLRSSDVPNMPSPKPHVEVFVMGRDVEGVHLRAGNVARGGIRWSDRKEDYRTEVLGLMKAQVTKNSVIVPTGAKGGFVLRRPPEADALVSVRAAYEVFIRGILDLTDNLVDGDVVHPALVRVHDDDDPYLVVAADKGTATFSDTANEIAGEYGFWLGDAFASGGSTGYDHKELGITARGAWMSLERHVLELGIDPKTDHFSVVGIGDMSGDVFGNGMLLSRTLQLVAAFDHRHVFIDPDPDTAGSLEERRRLFALPNSSWADYDRAIISEGGGVYSRSAKEVALSEEARIALGTDAEKITPSELIQIALTAPVDVLWNGGIGTYVKASWESNEDVGDRANDAVRVNGADLRCRVVVEGGNLGLTQMGRVEYAHSGGKVNTDFTDNSGGVNCSDREVNLKILLDLAVRRGELTTKDGHELLADVASDVVDRILRDSFQQAERIALEERTSAGRLDSYEQLMSVLEHKGILDRTLEGLPTTEEMTERVRSATGLSRPELGVLVAYSKRDIARSLLESDLLDESEMTDDLASYFPPSISQRFAHILGEHPLRRELLATMASNEIVHFQGSSFASQLMARTGATAAQVVRSYRMARDVSSAVPRRSSIEDLFGTMDPDVWAEVMNSNDRATSTMTRWFLRHPGLPELENINSWAGAFALLEENAAGYGPPLWQSERLKEVVRLEEAGVPQDLASKLALLPDLIHAPGIIDLAGRSGRSVAEVGRVFFRIGQAVHLDSLERILSGMASSDQWKRWARQTIEDDLAELRQLLAEQVLSEGGGRSADDAVDTFLAARSRALKRVLQLTKTLESGSDQDLTFFMVVVRQVESLATNR